MIGKFPEVLNFNRLFLELNQHMATYFNRLNIWQRAFKNCTGYTKADRFAACWLQQANQPHFYHSLAPEVCFRFAYELARGYDQGEACPHSRHSASSPSPLLSIFRHAFVHKNSSRESFAYVARSRG